MLEVVAFKRALAVDVQVTPTRVVLQPRQSYTFTVVVKAACKCCAHRLRENVAFHD